MEKLGKNGHIRFELGDHGIHCCHFLGVNAALELELEQAGEIFDDKFKRVVIFIELLSESFFRNSNPLFVVLVVL